MKFARGVGYWLAALVCGISWVIPVQGAEEELVPQEATVEEAVEGGKAGVVEEGRARPRRWWTDIGGTGATLETFGSLELTYDDNVFRYSDADRGTFNNNDATRRTQFRHVNHIDDIVTVPRLGLGLKKAFVPNRPTEVAFATTMHIYGSNTVKNYQEYEFDLKHRLGKDDILQVGYGFTPEFVLRNLFDTDQPSGQEYQLAAYSRHSLATSLWHRFSQVVRGRFLYQLDVRNYNQFFNERDNTAHAYNLTSFFHFSDEFIWRFYYEISHSGAEGKDDDAAVDPDLSYLQNELGTRLDVTIIPRVIVRPFYTWARRNFTTNNSSADDRLHRDRHDIRQSLGVRAIYELSKDGELYFGWERHHNDPSISFAAGVSGDTDVLGFDQDLLTLGCTFQL